MGDFFLAGAVNNIIFGRFLDLISLLLANGSISSAAYGEAMIENLWRARAS